MSEIDELLNELVRAAKIEVVALEDVVAHVAEKDARIRELERALSEDRQYHEEWLRRAAREKDEDRWRIRGLEACNELMHGVDNMARVAQRQQAARIAELEAVLRELVDAIDDPWTIEILAACEHAGKLLEESE